MSADAIEAEIKAKGLTVAESGEAYTRKAGAIRAADSLLAGEWMTKTAVKVQ